MSIRNPSNAHIEEDNKSRGLQIHIILFETLVGLDCNVRGGFLWVNYKINFFPVERAIL